MIAFPANADSSKVHPVLGKKSPERILNKDILALPTNERTAWVHGAVSGMITVLSSEKSEQAPCFIALYVNGGSGFEALEMTMKAYPDAAASTTVLAVADSYCPKG